MEVNPNDPLLSPNSHSLYSLLKKDFGGSKVPLLNFTNGQSLIGSDPVQKNLTYYFSVSRKIGHWYFRTSKYDSKTKFCRNYTKTKFCRNYTACPMSHSCEGRASFSSPLASPSWLVPYTNFLQVDPRVSTHLRGFFFFALQPINKCTFPQTLVGNRNACTFSVSHNIVFSPPGSQFLRTQHYCYVFLGCQHETQLNFS